MTFEELWPRLMIPGEYDSMDSTDQARWRMALRQAFDAGAKAGDCGLVDRAEWDKVRKLWGQP